MNIYYVYQYLRSKDSDIAESDTPYYIGKGKGKRAWYKDRKDIPKPTDKSLIELVVTGLSEKAAHELEIMLIKQYGRIDLGTGILRNKTNGGDGTAGLVVSAETRAKLSAAKKGKTSNRKGVKLTAETRAKISASNKGRTSTNEFRNKMSLIHKGRKHTDEARAKMSFSAKNRSSETRAKMSAANKGKIRGPHKPNVNISVV